jgi:ankyrin repeat protein
MYRMYGIFKLLERICQLSVIFHPELNELETALHKERLLGAIDRICNECGYTYLSYVCTSTGTSAAIVAEILLRIGADPNACDRFEMCPMARALANCGKHAYKLYKLLSANNAIYIKSVRGFVLPDALAEACYASGPCSVAIIKSLLDQNMDVNVRDSSQTNRKTCALSFACQSDGEYNHKVVELLLDRNANANSLNEYGFTPLKYLCSMDDIPNSVAIAKLLLNHGARKPGVQFIKRCKNREVVNVLYQNSRRK